MPIQSLLPYDVSPLTIMLFAGTLALYLLALRRLPPTERPGTIRVLAFMIGLVLCYAVMQTRFDYYAQYMFFVHRGQHLILHHVGPFLIALSNPLPILRYWHRRLPARVRYWLSPVAFSYRCLQQPWVAAGLFVGLIFFWLWPPVHFNAMLNRDLYWIMNWSMLADGLLFWWLMLDPRGPDNSPALGYGKRILILALVAVPQIILGASITFARDSVYDVYEVCGRAWPMAPATDQVVGGIITWIPPAMMSILAILLVLRRLLNQDRKSLAVAEIPSG